MTNMQRPYETKTHKSIENEFFKVGYCKYDLCLLYQLCPGARHI